ncbi:hypothetical protein [Ornithinibacillus sp. JPR2-1]
MNKEKIFKEEQKLMKKLTKTKSPEKQEEIRKEIERLNQGLRFVDKDE